MDTVSGPLSPGYYHLAAACVYGSPDHGVTSRYASIHPYGAVVLLHLELKIRHLKQSEEKMIFLLYMYYIHERVTYTFYQ